MRTSSKISSFIWMTLALLLITCAENDEKIITVNVYPDAPKYALVLNISPEEGGIIALDSAVAGNIVTLLDSVVASGDTLVYDENTAVYFCAIYAETSARYDFVGWTGDLSSDEYCVYVTMDGDKTLTANFETCTTGVDCHDDKGICITGDVCHDDYERETCAGASGAFTFGETCPVYHVLTVDINPTSGGTIIVKVDDEPIESDSAYVYTIREGTTAEVCAQLARNHAFVNWTGDVQSSVNCVDVLMDSAQTLTANFRRLRTYTLRVSRNVNGGDIFVTIGNEPTERVGGNGVFTVAEGIEVTLGISTCNGGIFNMWRIVVGGSLAFPDTEMFSTSFTPTFTMERDMDIIAHFGRSCSSGGNPPPPPPGGGDPPVVIPDPTCSHYGYMPGQWSSCCVGVPDCISCTAHGASDVTKPCM